MDILESGDPPKITNFQLSVANWDLTLTPQLTIENPQLGILSAVTAPAVMMRRVTPMGVRTVPGGAAVDADKPGSPLRRCLGPRGGRQQKNCEYCKDQALHGYSFALISRVTADFGRRTRPISALPTGKIPANCVVNLFLEQNFRDTLGLQAIPGSYACVEAFIS